MRPEELARQLGISGKTLRAWLRRRFPRGPLEHNTSWHLTEEQVRAAQLNFGGLYTSDLEGASSSGSNARQRANTHEDELSRSAVPRRPNLSTNHKALQEGYEPTDLNVLFVGESRPASGKYFYASDSTLYFAMRDAFEQTLGRGTDGGFLDFFQELGCYLTDLSAEPVNQLPFGSSERIAARRAGIPALTDLISKRKPIVLVAVLLDIEPEVRNAVQSSGESPVVHFLPFPRGQERTRFVRLLSELLTQFREVGYFPRTIAGE